MFESVRQGAAAIAPDRLKLRRLVVSCRKLLSERGEAAGVSLARITLDLYAALDKRGQAQFFAALLSEFSPDPVRVLAASKAYAAEQSAANLAQLSVAAEPPRQELLRRLNRAPRGTATILRMRERLLELKSEQRELEAVDWDFRHLLTTAVFYSISNCQPGLRGVSLGNFLIKNVVDVLSRECPRLKVFCTLSPVPGFVAWLEPLLRGGDAEQFKPLTQALKAVAAELGTDVAKVASDPAKAAERLARLKLPLTQLCATYLLHRVDVGEPALDPVARFHLNNGAKLERINWLANTSRKGLKESLGVMVNYLYEPKAIERNHERFVQGEIVASRQVRSLARGD
jgi:hypothetical protein